MLYQEFNKEFWRKIEKIREVMNRRQIQNLLITKVANFSWLTGGRSFVSIADETSVGKFLISMKDVCLITTNNEIKRLQDEELKDIRVKVLVYPWYQSIDQVLKNYSHVVLDADLDQELSVLRSQLTEQEMEKLRWLGQTSARILEDCCRNVSIGDLENEFAGNLSSQLWSEGIEPIVLNVAADERAYDYRHPIATDKKIEKYLSCSICTRKWGLHVTLTRIVHFGHVDDEISRRHRIAALIDSVAISNSMPDSNVKEIVDKMLKEYELSCFEDEWKQHPIGGLIGFKPREFDVVPGMEYNLGINQAFSWNPTIMGTKSEDTILITSSGAEIVTYTGEFDYVDIELAGKVVRRADILKR